MPLQQLESWEDVGRRVADARRIAGLTQQQLADALSLDRTAVAKIENGQRRLDALELGRLAASLGRTPEWFVTLPPPSVVSRRAERAEDVTFPQADDLLEKLARDVELLVDLDCLRPLEIDPLQVNNFDEAEQAANRIRKLLKTKDEPLTDLQRRCEDLGLYAFSLLLDGNGLDGAYVALQRGGVALINGSLDAGRRRFNLAHELGHHVMADEYSVDTAIGQETGKRERLINAFAIHLLLPRSSMVDRWKQFDGLSNPREALLHISVEFRVSWTAACAQARNSQLIDPSQFERLASIRPTRAEHLAIGLPIIEELTPTALPPLYSAGVVRAYRKHKATAERAVELLHGTISIEDLPPPDEVPLEAFRSDLQPLQ